MRLATRHDREMKAERNIVHDGAVERIAGDTVYVRFAASEACGSCRARQACGAEGARERIVAVRGAAAGGYAPGDAVRVGVTHRAGGRAVLLAYGGSLGVLLVVLAALHGAGCGDGAAAMGALAAVGLYFGVLRLLRRRIEQTIHFTITRR